MIYRMFVHIRSIAFFNDKQTTFDIAYYNVSSCEKWIYILYAVKCSIVIVGVGVKIPNLTKGVTSNLR